MSGILKKIFDFLRITIGFPLLFILGWQPCVAAQPFFDTAYSPAYLNHEWFYHLGLAPEPEKMPALDSNGWEPVKSPELEGFSHQVVWLRTRIPSLDIQDPYLFIRVFEQAFVVYVDDKPIYRFGQFPRLGQFQSPGSRWHMIELPDNGSGKMLTFGFYGRHHMMGLLKDHQIARERDIVVHVTQTQVIPFILGLLMILLGILTSFMYYQPSKRFAHSSLFVFSLTMGGVTISRSEFKQLLWDAPLFWSWFSAFSYHLMPLALLVFVRSLKLTYHNRWLNGMILIQSIFCVGSLSLALMNIISWLSSIRSLVILFALSALVILKDMFNAELRQQKEFRIFLGGFILFLIFAVGGGALVAFGWASLVYKPAIWGAFFFYLSLIYVLRYQAQSLHEQHQLADKASRYKDLFLAKMSHELRTPLNSVIGFSKILLKNKKGVLAEQDLNYLHRIHENGKYLLELVNNILDISKIEADKMDLEESSFSLLKLLDELNALVEPLLRSDKNTFIIQNRLSADTQLHTTDRKKLFQILLNLVSNAIKFTSNGIITLHIHVPEPDWICFSIIDTGIGITKEALPHLFQNFSQVDLSPKHKAQGSGLGLAISQKLAQLMQGHIKVQSVWEKGSTFSLYLPFRSSVIGKP